MNKAAGEHCTREHFREFFENEFVSRGSETRLAVTNALALLAVPPVLYTFYLIKTCRDIGRFFPGQHQTVQEVFRDLLMLRQMGFHSERKQRHRLDVKS